MNEPTLNDVAQLQRAGRWPESVAALRRIIALRPDFLEGYFQLAGALRVMGAFDEAETVLKKAVTINPNHARTFFMLGDFWASLTEFRKAADALRRATELQPDFMAAWINLGTCWKNLGDFDRAMVCYDRALEIDPNSVPSHSNRLYALYFHPKYDNLKIHAEHVRWNGAQGEPLGKEIRPHGNERNPDRKIRVGYVGPDFRNHCQSFFTIPLLSNHDRGNFEIFAYADVSRPDEITRRIQKYCDQWRNIVGMNDEQVAQFIRGDEIDILVDLTMHMAGGRPLLFARKPAPVVVAWLAYPGTTGLKTVDYRLTDPYLDPVGFNDEFYSEKTIRLPHSFWCYDPLTDQPKVNELPALSNGYITFGCLNNFCKLNAPLLKRWAAVLRAVPDSRFVLLAPRGGSRQMVLQELKVTADRVEFVDLRARPQYLSTYHRIDLGLDTFPYNGHTTSLDSLWMGVPVVSLMGHTAVSRAGFSQMSNLGLTSELIAQSEEGFVELVKSLANNLHRLRELRSTLRQRMVESPLMNGPLFASHVETVYRQIWRQWCLKTA
jgi:protein O-GlcNAc transferase